MQFRYSGGELYCESVRAADIAREVGTPVYVYSKAGFLEKYGEIHAAFSGIEHVTCYSVKTNSNLAILKALAGEGCGFDIVSGGELFRVLKIGGDPDKTVFAGVGKTVPEIRAALSAGILMFNVESEAELERINHLAGEIGAVAPVAFRVNPDVDPKTHRYTTTGKAETKFGMDFERTARLAASTKKFPHARLTGLHMHLGSPIATADPYAEALDKLSSFIDKKGLSDRIEYINIGGGFGIDYKPRQSVRASDYAAAIVPRVKSLNKKLLLEPGRYISGNSGILLAEIQYVKDSGRKRFWITDAAMNDLIRPALYQAFHEIWPVRSETPPPLLGGTIDEDWKAVDIVGPVCETGDFFAMDRKMPPAASGDLTAVFSAGAYGATMSSRYNQRPLPPEVVVDGDRFFVARQRETYEDMAAAEKLTD